MVFQKQFNELSNIELFEIAQLRQTIFMVEQEIIETDLDDYDLKALHCFIKRNGHIVAYARLIDVHDTLYIGRVVTHKDYRMQGLMREIFESLQATYETLAVSAQVQVMDAYKKLGFKPVGKRYKDAGIPHQKMIFIKGMG